MSKSRSALTHKPAPETSKRMKAVRRSDTAPELEVRQLLHRLGARFRVCPRDLPGRPDIANKSRQWCVFVHGCFWHGHRSCVLARLPRTNRAWWREKISANRKRDARKVAAMRELGFRVAVVWQCELLVPSVATRRLKLLLRQSKVRSANERAASLLKSSATQSLSPPVPRPSGGTGS
jgi:DNA mismatch endonuclease Vsr